MKQKTSQAGYFSPLLAPLLVAIVVVIALAGFGIWAYSNYQDQKNNVDSKIAVAVAGAKKQQQSDDQKLFDQQEKLPTRQFVGPDDYGRVQIDYPKTWSVFLNRTDGPYDVYFQPGVVPPLTSGTPYALHITIDNNAYENVLNSYQNRVKSGDLQSSAITIDNQNGVRLDGKFSDKIQGSMVLFKVRDKTLRIYTDSDTFISDYNTILTTLKFNP